MWICGLCHWRTPYSIHMHTHSQNGISPLNGALRHKHWHKHPSVFIHIQFTHKHAYAYKHMLIHWVAIFAFYITQAHSHKHKIIFHMPMSNERTVLEFFLFFLYYFASSIRYWKWAHIHCRIVFMYTLQSEWNRKYIADVCWIAEHFFQYIQSSGIQWIHQMTTVVEFTFVLYVVVLL